MKNWKSPKKLRQRLSILLLASSITVSPLAVTSASAFDLGGVLKDVGGIAQTNEDGSISLGSDALNRLITKVLVQQLGKILPFTKDLYSVAGDVFGFETVDLVKGEGLEIKTDLDQDTLDAILGAGSRLLDRDDPLDIGFDLVRDLFGRDKDGRVADATPDGHKNSEIICQYAGCSADSSSKSDRIILEDSAGPLGIPNPNKVRGTILGAAARGGAVNDIWARNAIPAATHLANNQDRNITRTMAEAVLSEPGQERMKETTEQIGDMLESIGEDATAAAEAGTTQQVLKTQTLMLAKAQTFTAALVGNTIEEKIDRKIDHINQANISATLDEISRHNQTEVAAQAGAAISQSMINGLF